MTQTDDELDEILRAFDGGINAEGSDKGGYPTYFTEPYPLWLANRKETVMRLIKSREERLTREALQKSVEVVESYLSFMVTLTPAQVGQFQALKATLNSKEDK